MLTYLDPGNVTNGNII